MIDNLKRIVIATGGTGGHIFPAYSLAKYFIEKKIDVQITSDQRGLKYLSKYDELKITQINSSTIFDKNIIRLFFSIIKIFRSLIESLKFLKTNKPDLVFGMGGYSSFPVCIAAKLLKIPFIIYENNLIIGKANKYLMPLATKIFVSQKELDGVSKKHQDKVCEIGNIIRREILNFQTNYLENQKNKQLNILVLGGSQAAKIFGERLPEIFNDCVKNNILLKIYQQCLPEQNKSLKLFYKNLNIDSEIFNFSENLTQYFSKTNLAITRAGSSMLAELINCKIPFISVPLPSSADNHQLKNAIFYEKNKYSYLIEEKDLSEKLFKLIKQIYEDETLLKKLINQQRQFSDKSVYKNIDNQLKEIFNEKN